MFDLRIRGALLCIVLLLAAPLLAAEPDKPPTGDAMIEKYLARETERLSQRVLDGATNRADWEARRPRLKQEYFDMLGLWPLPEKTPLHPQVTGTLERDDFIVEKLHFQSRPGLYVTGNLYRPRKGSGKLPAVLYVCGHSPRGRNGNKTAFQDHGMWFATNGYVCLAIDSLQLGEIAGKHHGTYNLNRWWWQARGYTPAGVECWNGIRALDYLVSRPDVDPERLAVTGISGGGAATLWISAADERVKCAVPVSGMSDLESYVTNKIINGHCDCMLMINTYGWEWTTFASLVAPRPMLFANSDNDRIFPMDGNRRIIDRLRKTYQLFGKPELVDDYVSKGGHDYRPDLRVAVFRWINKHLKNDTGEVKDAKFEFFPDEQLRVFPEDKDLPADARNARIDEEFVPAAKVQLPEPGKFEEWKQSMLKQLRERSFRVFPERAPVARFEKRTLPLLSFETELGVLVGMHQHEAAADLKLITVVVLNSDESTKETPPYAHPAKGEAVVLLEPRGGSGGTGWTRKNPPNYVERAHALIGCTADQGRVLDVAAMCRWLSQKNDGKRWRLMGKGQAGVLAAYAALLEPSIPEVVVLDPPASHRDGPIFLNVLRVLDIPEALGLLAPRSLEIIGGDAKAFDRTAEIYRLAGAKGKLKR